MTRQQKENTMTQTPYVCRTCGQGWHSNFTRCIGTDGKHRPVTPIRDRRWKHWGGSVMTRQQKGTTMSHAPECSGRIYGCLTCGRRDLTIGETFDHHCVPSTATATAYSAIMKNGKQVKGWCHSRADAELVYGRRGWEIVEIEIVVPEAVA